MSKNFKRPQVSMPNAQSQIQQDGDYSMPGRYPSNGASQLRVPTTPFPNVQPGIQQNGNSPTSGRYPSNGASQFKVPFTPRLNAQLGEQIEQSGYYSTPGAYSPNGASQFKVSATPFVGVPATSYPSVQPAVVDPPTRDHVERYPQWFQQNNNLTVSSQKIHAYQDATKVPRPMRISEPPIYKWLHLPVRQKFDVFGTLRMPAVRRASEQHVNLKLKLGKLLYIFVVTITLNLLFIGAWPHNWLNWYLTIVWSAYLPITIIGLLGAIASQKQLIQPYTGIRQERVIFLIPTIARKDTLPGLGRVIDSILLCAPCHLPNFAIHVLVEEEAEGVEEIKQRYKLHDRVLCIVVPRGYTPKNGTRYKARANEYALHYRKRVGLNGPDVFIYHGDDDTSIAHDTIWSIAQFIESNQHDLAQGLLTYPHHLTRSWFCRLADSIRPADDMSRFYFCTGKLGTPLAGLHGEHLLIRASIEDQIGWDFGPAVKVEDAYFGLKFAELHLGRATFLPSCSYGASPATVRDLVTQRRRWASGLMALLFDRQVSWKVKPILCFSIANWIIGIFQNVVIVLVVAWYFNLVHTSPIIPMIVVFWVANFSFQLWLYLEGLRINLEASQAKPSKFYIMPLILIPAIPCLSMVEAWSALLGSYDFLRRKQDFAVISKEY